jgi:hypothetical protein
MDDDDGAIAAGEIAQRHEGQDDLGIADCDGHNTDGDREGAKRLEVQHRPLLVWDGRAERLF